MSFDLILDKTYSTMLKELKMRLWSTSKCNSTAHWNGNITGGYLCAGYQSNLKSVCTVCLLLIHNIKCTFLTVNILCVILPLLLKNIT